MLWPSPATSSTSAPPRLPIPIPATLSFAFRERLSAPLNNLPGRMLNNATPMPARWINCLLRIVIDLCLFILLKPVRGSAYLCHHIAVTVSACPSASSLDNSGCDLIPAQHCRATRLLPLRLERGEGWGDVSKSLSTTLNCQLSTFNFQPSAIGAPCPTC